MFVFFSFHLTQSSNIIKQQQKYFSISTYINFSVSKINFPRFQQIVIDRQFNRTGFNDFMEYHKEDDQTTNQSWHPCEHMHCISKIIEDLRYHTVYISKLSPTIYQKELNLYHFLQDVVPILDCYAGIIRENREKGKWGPFKEISNPEEEICDCYTGIPVEKTSTWDEIKDIHTGTLLNILDGINQIYTPTYKNKRFSFQYSPKDLQHITKIIEDLRNITIDIQNVRIHDMPYGSRQQATHTFLCVLDFF